MMFKISEIFVLLVLAVISDIRTCRIKNIITMPFALAGILTNLAIGGCNGLKLSLLGWLVPAVLLFALYAAGMLGAGDIKLLSSIGAIMGFEFAAGCIVYSFLSGGLIGIIAILARKNAAVRLKYLFNYLKACLLCVKILEYDDFKGRPGSGRFRFSYAVVPGTLLQLLLTLFGGN